MRVCVALDMVVYTVNSSTWEAEASGPSRDLMSSRTDRVDNINCFSENKATRVHVALAGDLGHGGSPTA